MAMKGGFFKGGDECDCSCHQGDGTIHVMACCDGQCQYCWKFIATGMMDAHIKAEHNTDGGVFERIVPRLHETQPLS
ncbi:MAG: hypothetical protein HY457_01810 [Parcubacteria group bacterium]|nr:hypothetical protein [Parcubacteria group bacterium]